MLYFIWILFIMFVKHLHPYAHWLFKIAGVLNKCSNQFGKSDKGKQKNKDKIIIFTSFIII